MMATTLTLLMLLLAALAPARPTPPCKPQLAPMRTGTSGGPDPSQRWTEEQAGEWGGEGWLGWDTDSDRLVPVRLVITRGDEKLYFPEVLAVKAEPDVDFAVRCIPSVRPGAIRSIPVAQFGPEHPLIVTLGSRRYELRLDSRREDLSDARVVLSDGRRTQVLYAAGGFADEPHYDIEWVGDLDGDARLDLLVNLSRKYSGHPYRLLLSSKARRGELVGDAALFETGD